MILSGVVSYQNILHLKYLFPLTRIPRLSILEVDKIDTEGFNDDGMISPGHPIIFQLGFMAE